MANVETDPIRGGAAGVAQALQHTAKEGLLVWGCTSAAYLDYFTALAYAEFVSAMADLAIRASGSMQSYHGVISPTLNDA